MKNNAVIFLGLLFTQATHASGLYFYEIATEDAALAGAGQAARAQDASTIVTNPAGMTRFPDAMFNAGLQGMGGDISVSQDDEPGHNRPD